jgi:hypothetical protein
LICVPSASAVAILERWRVAGFVGWPMIRLYVNDVIPSQATVLGDLMEAPFDAVGGPQEIPFVRPAFLNPDGKAEIDAEPVVWTNSGTVDPFTVYGYYVTDNADSLLLWAERFAGATLMASPGQQIIWQPSLTLTSEYQ